MIRKYIVLFFLTGLFFFIVKPTIADTKKTEKIKSESLLLLAIIEKHDMGFEKRSKLLQDTWDCVEEYADHKKSLQSGYKLLSYYDDIIVNFPNGFAFNEEGPEHTYKEIIKIVESISWCPNYLPEEKQNFIDLVRRMVDLKILNKKILYNKKENPSFGSAWMNYSKYVSESDEKIESRWLYDEKILKILTYNTEKTFKDLNSYMIFSNQEFVDNYTRAKVIKYLKPIVNKKNVNFKNEIEKKDYVTLSRNYFYFLLADKQFKECINFYDKKIKKINFSYKEIKNKLDVINYQINCLMSDLNWDDSYKAFYNKVDYMEDALKNFEYEKEIEISLHEELARSYISIVAGLNITAYSKEEQELKNKYLARVEEITNEYLLKESKYHYLIVNKLLVDQYVYRLEIEKAEKNLNASLIQVENLTAKDGYPFKDGFKDQKAEIESDYLAALGSIFVHTKRYKEAISVNEKIIESTSKILSVGWNTNLKIAQQNNLEAFKYKQAHIQLFIIYNIVSDRRNQEKYLKKISEFCNPQFTSSECMFFYQQKMVYATQIENLNLMNEAYGEMETYYNNFFTESIYVKYMTDTELLKHQVTIWAHEEQKFINDPKKKDSQEHKNLRKNVCNKLQKLEKRNNRIEKQLAKQIKNESFKERTAYIKIGTYFMIASAQCKFSKNQLKTSIKLFEEAIQLEKKKLEKWMNLPSNFYQYEVDTNLISQMATAVAFYKDEFDKNNNNVQISNLLKDIFSLTQYGKNLFITNSIKNSINQRINNNKEIENLMYERNTITTRLDLLMKDIINNPSVTEAKFDNKNKLEIKLSNINNEIKTKFPDFEKNLKSKFYKVEDVQEKLKSDEVLIVYDSFDSPFAHIIYKDNYDTFHNSPLKIKSFRKLIYEFRKGLFDEKVQNINDVLDLFYNAFFKKIDNKISNYKKIIIISDRFTEDLPLGMLFDKDEKKYLAEKYSISYQPSVGSFVELRKQPKSNTLSYDSAFLGIGDPALQQKSLKDYIVSITDIGLNTRGVLEDSSIIKQRYENLPYTRNEIMSLSKLFDNNKILLSKEANEKNIKNINLEQYDIISFATHAAVSGTLKETSEPFLVLTPPKKTSYLNDGILTASEISQLNLNANLVILSACNTASKENEYAPGFSGLVAAFFKAGAKSVLATHWPVADKATSIMINETINKTVKKNINLSEALQLTKVQFIEGKYGEKYKNPMYWASYVIIGN
jgi:CHAT domain-containing protein